MIVPKWVLCLKQGKLLVKTNSSFFKNEPYKKRVGKNEKGVTLVEAAIVLPVFLFTILCALLIFGQCFRIFSTYYAMFESMRLSSVQPVGTNATVVLNNTLTNRLVTYQTGISREKIIARVPDGTANGICMQLVASNPPKYWPN